jgi:hypothetical protein
MIGINKLEPVEQPKRRCLLLVDFAGVGFEAYVGRRSPPCPPPALVTVNRQLPSGGFFGRVEPSGVIAD